MADWNPQSRVEEILFATINGEPYNGLPQSRIEELLLELKAVIEAGGGGGTTNYNLLSNLPQINDIVLKGNKTAADLNLVLAEVGKGLSTNDYSDEEKAKVTNLITSIQSILDGTDIDSFGDVEIALLDKADTSDLGTAAAKDSTNAVTSGSTDLVESGAVKDAIDAAVSSAYHHAGTKTVAQLTHDLLIAANEGNVYNITDSGTTTSDFIEGIGKTIDEGSNVGICKVGDVYMFDLLSGFVDTTNFVQKSQTSGLLKNDGTVNTTIEDDVDQVKSGLTNVNSDLSSKVGRINTDVEAPIRTNLFDKDNKIIEYKYYDGTSWHDVSAGTWQTIFVPVIGGLTYTASGFPAQGGVKTVFTTGDKTTVLADYSAADNNQTFTAPSNSEYIGFGIYSPNANYDSAKFEIGSTATTYTAYTPSVNERLDAVESVVDVSTQNIKLFNTTNNNITAEIHATTNATEIVNDKYNNGAVVNSIRLYLDVNNKCIKAAYFNGESWDRRTIIDFTTTP